MSSHEPPPRTEYAAPPLEASDLDPDPMAQWRFWLAAAFGAGIIEPHAACLATVGPDGRPSGRMVLVRAWGETSLAFFTNYGSRKGRELSENPNACLTFYWPELHRQVRVEGRVTKTSAADSDAYFAARPYQSQIASAASPQSRPVPDRLTVESRMDELKVACPSVVPRPAHWGGYLLEPDRWEFWQGQPARLHDRFEYGLSEGHWVIVRLAP